MWPGLLRALCVLSFQFQLATPRLVERSNVFLSQDCDCNVHGPSAFYAQAPAGAPAAAAANPPGESGEAGAATPPPVVVEVPAPCPCMTSTVAPVAAPEMDWAGMIRAAAKKSADEGMAKIGGTASEEGAEDAAELTAEGPGSPEAEKEEEAAEEKTEQGELAATMTKLQQEQAQQDAILEELKNNAKNAALKNAGEVTMAAEDLATIKAQNTIGKVIQGVAEKAEASYFRAEATRHQAESSEQVMLAISVKAQTAAQEAKAAAGALPKEATLEAIDLAMDAQVVAKSTSGQAGQGKKMAEMASQVSGQAKTVSAIALEDTEKAKVTAAQALEQAKANAGTLGGLKARAAAAVAAAQGAITEAEEAARVANKKKMAEAQAAAK